jgi:hypothetical protein
VDITVTSDSDFYKFVAPANSNADLRITVQSQGLSLLSPRFWVYNADYEQLAYFTSYGSYGTKMQQTLSGILQDGETYYIKVAGAEPATAFGTGAYAFTINMGPYGDLGIVPPNTTTANGSPIVSGGAIAQVDYFYAEGHAHDDVPATDLPGRAESADDHLGGLAPETLEGVASRRAHGPHGRPVAHAADPIWLEFWSEPGEDEGDDDAFEVVPSLLGASE